MAAWTGSVAPACTLVIWCGPLMVWKIRRETRDGATPVALCVARKFAFVTGFQSCSGFAIKSKTAGKAELFRVVSMWKTFTCSSSRAPIRFIEPCIAELGGSMRERLAERVSGLWWWRIEGEGERAVGTDLWRPAPGAE